MFTRRDIFLAAAGSITLTSPQIYVFHEVTEIMRAENAVAQRIIDCSRDPFNIRPAYQAIMHTQNWILDRLPADKKLVIIMGESHNLTLNALLLQASIRELHKQQKANPDRSVAVSIELPSNFSEMKRGVKPSDDQSRMRANVDSFQRDGFFIWGYDGHSACLEFCMRANIPISFHDVTMTPRIEIIAASPESERVINSYPVNVTGQRVNSKSRDHMAVRNMVCVEHVVAQTEASGARIVVVSAGAAHIGGYNKFPYKESLTALFMNRGFSVLPVNMDWSRYSSTLSAEGLSAMAQGVPVQGMAERISDHNDDRRHTFYPETRDIVNARSQMALT